jgi:ribosomal protein S6--L-glutamate ligase
VLRIGVISAYGEDDWHAQRIAQAAAQCAGVGEVDRLVPTDFSAEVRRDGAHIRVRGRDAGSYDLFLTPRALGDEGDPDVQIELYRALARGGARLVNDVDALLVAIDKFRTSCELERAGLPTPEVRLVQRREDAESALDDLGAAVVKPVYGSLGQGVERLDSGARGRIAQLLERHGALYLQRFVNDVSRDVRAFVVGERVVQAVARQPIAGEFRANCALGAALEPCELGREVAELAVRATAAVGLDYAGVDLLLARHGPELIEVNGTPSFRGIYEATGQDMAIAIVEHATAGGRTVVASAGVR